MTAAVQRQTIPWGDDGSIATLHAMRDMVSRAITTPIVVDTAHTIIRSIRPRDYHAIALAIRFFLAQNFRFIADPVGVELIRTPERLIRQHHVYGYMSGDCDDVATLGAALGKSVGVPARFVAIGFKSFGPLAHVFTTLLPSNGPAVSLDVTRPAGVKATIQRRRDFSV